MMHPFPRALPLERGHRRPDAPRPEAAVQPLTPAAYLRLCREAAGLSASALATRIAEPADREIALALVHLLETPGVKAKRDETLEVLHAAFAFDPDVYRQLAAETDPERHPRICRGCGASAWDARDTMGEGLAWATDTRCTRCLPTTGENHGPANGCFQ